MRQLFIAAGLLGLSACAVVAPMSAGARAQEASNELNTNTRFGRLEIATESVDPAHREDFLKSHKLWGNTIRIADYEMAGFKLKDTDHAESLVTVSWYRVETGDLKVTLIRQSWKQTKGDWRLTEETKADGDAGLLGDTALVAPETTKRPTQFPTIHLGSTLGAVESEPEAEDAKAAD